MSYETVAVAPTLDGSGQASVQVSPSSAGVARVAGLFLARTGGSEGSSIITLTDNVGDSPFLYQNQFTLGTPKRPALPDIAGVAPFTLAFSSGPAGQQLYVLVIFEV